MNEHEIETVRRHLGAALVHLARGRSRHVRDEDLSRAAEALDRASAVLREPIDDTPPDHA